MFNGAHRRPGTRPSNQTNALLEGIGGGLLASSSVVDALPGEIESTGNNFNVALQGDGFLAVSSAGKIHLTRNGQMAFDRTGRLVMSNDPNQAVLDSKQTPIVLDATIPTAIAQDGTITQNGKPVAALGLFDVSDPSTLGKDGASAPVRPRRHPT